MLKIVQLGLVSMDMPGTMRLFTEALGFRNAGGQGLWGGMSSKIPGLRSDVRSLMWWFVGSRTFFQIELSNFTCPVSQPLPTDWRPSDIGWTRFGIVVPDFDTCLEGLKSNGVEPLTPPITKAGKRHVAFRDPYIGAIVEMMESDPKNPDGPFVAYATSSVSDLEKARGFYRDVLELELLPLEQLHAPSDEALWGLPGAERDGFLARMGDFLIEVVHYRKPKGRPKPPGYQLSDQGIMNIAIASRQIEPAMRMLERVKAAGYNPPHVFNNGKILAAYITDPERAFEFGAVPEELDAIYGFVASPYGAYRRIDKVPLST